MTAAESAALAAADDLRQQLKGALKSRAMAYSAIFDEIAKEVGEAKAEAIMKRAVYARGAAAGARFFSGHAPDDFAGLREHFLDFLPDHGGLFDVETLRCDGEGLDIKFHTCPIKEAWEEAGIPPKRMQALCAVAGSVDVGTFEKAGFAITNETWQVGGQGCCLLRISKKREGDGDSI